MDNNVNSSSDKHEERKLSLCDVLKEDTSEIIKKLESQTPSILQNYSDLYTAYLHMFDDIFDTCYISEKQFFDKLDIDPIILKQIKENSKTVKKIYLENMGMNAKYGDEYFKMRILTVKSFDNFIHVLMKSYTKMLLHFNIFNSLPK